VSREKQAVLVLRECKACGFVACACIWRDHAEDCTRRRVVLGTERDEKGCPINRNPSECARHQIVACADCFPCSCSKAGELAAWLEREQSKIDGLIAGAGAPAPKGKEAA
jgi:hypothetical protein